jgi:Mg-chelatase subunit ChlD
VLLLTDGINDDSTGGLSEDEVVERLERAREDGDRPVTVVLIGMGPDVDAEALDRLATAAGGESFVLRDPRELPQVFIDVVARRAP